MSSATKATKIGKQKKTGSTAAAGSDAAPADPALACAEDNPFTPIVPGATGADDPVIAPLRAVDPAKSPLRLSLEPFVGAGETDIPPAEYERIRTTGRMSFHAIGCSGDPAIQTPQAAVADDLIADLSLPEPPAFLFHLGDIVYKIKKDEAIENGSGALAGGKLLQVFYTNEFYGAYRGYARPIFAIPGNHDGKYKAPVGPNGLAAGPPELPRSPMWRFLRNFCAAQPLRFPAIEEGAGDPSRPTMTQPYPYFLLETPVACVLGLYTNVCNGGALALEKPGKSGAVQYAWLTARLREIQIARQGGDNRALIVATHYPPFSGAPNFALRGDVQSASTPGPRPALPLAQVLLSAFTETNVWPDLVLSAHAHHYQRLTYTVTRWDAGTQEQRTVRQIPFVIIGSGGHSPVEYLWRDCAGKSIPERTPPFAAVLPPGMPAVLPHPGGDAAAVQLAAYNDQDFGLLRVTVDAGQRLLTGEFRASYRPESALRPGRVRDDVFHVRLDRSAL